MIIIRLGIIKQICIFTHFPFIAFIDPSSNFNSFTVILKLARTPSISINRSENKNENYQIRKYQII